MEQGVTIVAFFLLLVVSSVWKVGSGAPFYDHPCSSNFNSLSVGPDYDTVYRTKCRLDFDTSCHGGKGGHGGSGGSNSVYGGSRKKRNCQIIYETICEDEGKVPNFPYPHPHQRPACRQVPSRVCKPSKKKESDGPCRKVPVKRCQEVPVRVPIGAVKQAILPCNFGPWGSRP